MIEEPYRWLEAVANRREYVQDQIKSGTPVFAVSLSAGIALIGVGSGDSKVFELFDRHALAGLGHPADLEKIRQALIDAAHTEAFTRAPEDVSLRRLVGFGVSPQLKNNFEQIFNAPYLVELVLAELGANAGEDSLVRLHYDGSYQIYNSGVVAVVPASESEAEAQRWLNEQVSGSTDVRSVVDLSLQAWWCLSQGHAFDDAIPSQEERQAGWRSLTEQRTVEIGWLARDSQRHACYAGLTLSDLGL